MIRELTVAIIAGGKSKRFGAQKALAQLAGKRLIDYALTLANNISEEVLLNVNDTNKFVDIAAKIIPDLQPACGPLGGIYTVLQSTKTDWVAILPCDMPLLSGNVYEILFENRRENLPVVAVSHRGVEPLVSIWPKRIAESEIWVQKFAENNFALHKTLRQLNACEIDMTKLLTPYQPEIFLNVNYPGDFARVSQIIEKSA